MVVVVVAVVVVFVVIVVVVVPVEVVRVVLDVTVVVVVARHLVSSLVFSEISPALNMYPGAQDVRFFLQDVLLSL